MLRQQLYRFVIKLTSRFRYRFQCQKSFRSNVTMSSASEAFGQPQPPLVVVLGATGAGKSKLAIEIAKAFNGEIISADSMQIYKGLDILTNKVTKEEEKECRHHLIGYLEANHKHHNVIDFKKSAIPLIDSLLEQKKIPVIVGGTNYYIESLLWNFTIDDDDQPFSQGDSDSEENEEDEVGINNSQTDRVIHWADLNMLEKDLLEKILALKGESPETILKSLGQLSPADAFWCLTQIDPETASKNHPNNTRKIERAIQYFLQSGNTLSSAHKSQHQGHALAKSGPLRYPNTCIIWVKCNQIDLDNRTDKRVDTMLERGIVKELEEFYNEMMVPTQCNDTEETNMGLIGRGISNKYPHGFLQNIGFKEFQKYLILSDIEKNSSKGEDYLNEGLEKLKQVTRKYARRQNKWITRRFCNRPGPNVPKVYSVDSTDVSQWNTAVREALDVVQAFCQGEMPKKTPESPSIKQVQFERNTCQFCDGLVCLSVHDWNNHLRSKKHKYNVKKMKREHIRLTQILEAQKHKLSKDVTDSDN